MPSNDSPAVKITLVSPGLSPLGVVMAVVPVPVSTVVAIVLPDFFSTQPVGKTSAVSLTCFTLILSMVTPLTVYLRSPLSIAADPAAVASNVVLVFASETPKDAGALLTVPAIFPLISVMDLPYGSVVTVPNVSPLRFVFEVESKVYFVFV